MQRGPDVHVTLRWGPTVVRTACVSASRPLVVGEGVWSVPDDAIGGASFALLQPQGDGLRLDLPPRAQAWVSDGRAGPFRPAPAHVLSVGSRARVELGALAVDIDVEPPSLAPPHARPKLAALLHPLASAVLHAASIGILAFWSPPLAADEPSAEETSDNAAFMVAALDGHAAPERDEKRAHDDTGEHLPPGDAGDPQRAGGTGTRSTGAEGAQGTPTADVRGHRMAIEGPRDTPDPSVARAAAAREAEAFGIIGLLDTGPSASPDAPLVTWGRDASTARDPANARAPLFGTTIHDAFAWGGVGLSGTGEGGGGRAEAIGLGEIGVLGLGAGTGTGDDLGMGGFGGGGWGEGGGGRGQGIGMDSFGSLGHDGGQGFSSDRGRFSGRTHTTTAPRVRMAEGALTSTGRLPPEAIQRVVRQNAGRFRLCYQHGLEKQPALRGRVVTRFLIARDGTVSVAADDGSDIADASVAACVTRTFLALSFPEPAGGTVSVVYPFTFEPE
jgi:hypothetical protein